VQRPSFSIAEMMAVVAVVALVAGWITQSWSKQAHPEPVPYRSADHDL
jgi:Tfp pilus assembly protein PilE